MTKRRLTYAVTVLASIALLLITGHGGPSAQPSGDAAIRIGAGAEYYPAIYWYPMLKAPDKGDFPGTGPDGNGIAPAMKSQQQWLDVVKTNGCYTCHQLGNKATRAIPKELGDFASSIDAWQRRIVAGQAMTQMANNLGRLDPKRATELFADWTDRIAAGELPPSRPQRPQ